MTENSDDLATRLDEAMRKAGFGTNQSSLARASDVQQSTINRILKRKLQRQGPSVETIKALADACNVSPLWLLDGEPQNASKSVAATKKTQAIPANFIDGEEVLELFRLYKEATPKGRGEILKIARSVRK